MTRPVRRPAFIYWGRRGPVLRMARDLIDAAQAANIECFLSLSRQNSGFSEFADLGDRMVPVSTFQRAFGAITRIGALPRAWRTLRAGLERHRSDAVIVLMPHVWTPLIAPHVQALDLPYAVVVHDGRSHPGDPTGLVNHWLWRDAHRADLVFTLSDKVADDLHAMGIPRSRLVPLFHPDLGYRGDAGGGPAKESGRLRALFFGRILPYKGLSLFVDALERLVAQGYQVEASVVGEGSLGQEGGRLARLGATVINHWVADDQIASIFQAHDVVVLSHLEASQSGVVAAAFAQGVPVVVTPVGGLAEQVQHNETGLVSERVSGEAIAASLSRLIDEPLLLPLLRKSLAKQAEARSPGRFLHEMLAAFQR